MLLKDLLFALMVFSLAFGSLCHAMLPLFPLGLEAFIW